MPPVTFETSMLFYQECGDATAPPLVISGPTVADQGDDAENQSDSGQQRDDAKDDAGDGRDAGVSSGRRHTIGVAMVGHFHAGTKLLPACDCGTASFRNSFVSRARRLRDRHQRPCPRFVNMESAAVKLGFQGCEEAFGHRVDRFTVPASSGESPRPGSVARGSETLHYLLASRDPRRRPRTLRGDGSG